MPRPPHLALPLLGLLLTVSAAPAESAPVCRLTMSPVAVRGATYRVDLRLSPGCQDQTFRVRKSSTTSLRRNDAPYQPIRPTQGAWTIGKRVNTVPPAELFTLFTWEWQVYSPQTFDTLAGRWGAWVRIPQDGRPL